ncbi:unnamed protein product, partial [Effrenium voratum]
LQQMVVGLGCLGVVTELTLRLQPAFRLRQRVFAGKMQTLSSQAALDSALGCAYAVSLWTTWEPSGPDMEFRLWAKELEGEPLEKLLEGHVLCVEQFEKQHPLQGLDPSACTDLGLGWWHERLAHFKAEFIPSSGAELQSEYFVPRRFASEALQALARISSTFSPLLLCSEIRAVASDRLLLSPNCARHVGEVTNVLFAIEGALERFQARPHWGKLFVMPRARLEGLYGSALQEFRLLAKQLDPEGKFCNSWVLNTIGDYTQEAAPLADKGVESEVLEYITALASDLLQEATDRKEVEEELEGALVPHLEAAGIDDSFVKTLLDGIFPEKKAVAKKAGAKKAGNGDTDSNLVCLIPNLILMYGGSVKPLLSNTGFELRRGRRYGIVGQNGAGKTTLMSRVAVGDLPGMEMLKCYHLEHEGILDNIDKKISCSEYVRLKCSGISSTATDKSLSDVGFDKVMFSKAVGELSGGWKMRLALACAVAQGADVFLLDEPTNHLDSVAVKWLQSYLVDQGERITAMIISHDAGFLNHACTDIVHFTKHGKLEYHEGNFDHFREKTKLDAEGAKEVLKVRGHEGKMEEKEHHEIKQLGTTPELADDEMRFPLPGKIEGLGTASKPVATVTNLNFKYFEDGPLVLKEVTVRLTMGSRIGVVGRNGAGKSTLLNLLAGELLPPEDETGEVSAVWRHRNLRLAYIAQHHFFHLSEFLKSTPLHYFQTRFRQGYDEETQRRLTLPQNEEEEKYRKDMAAQHGKRGKEVEALLSRQKIGKQILYEVKWKGLDDAKQRTPTSP